jgi:HD superfamily phosphohydrolase YqeK
MSSSVQVDLELPDWAVVTPPRRAHIARVAALVREWADEAGLPAYEKSRWFQAAILHDALRDASPIHLRNHVPQEFGNWPDALLHGPAAAARLRLDHMRDEGVLNAITYHTVGHPELDAAGRALFLADFLEPGRTFDPLGRAAWRARMPHDLTAVLREVVGVRIQHMINSQRPIRSETLAFWNQITTG